MSDPLPTITLTYYREEQHMGACSFETTATGPTAEDAFRRATESAAWEYGHGGYTGTIAEKGAFVLTTLPDGYTVETFIALLWNASMGYQNERCGTFIPKNATESYRTLVLTSAEREAEALATLRALVGTDRAAKLIATLDDKWGPCLAVASGENEWTFFGMASC